MTEGSRLRVVVVTFNNASFIERCVQAIVDSEWSGDRDIVVVDNASSDNTADLVAGAFPEVRLIRSPVNRGFGAGNNLALRDLDEVDFVALVNSDAFVTRSWLAPLRAALEADSSLGAAGPKVLFEPRSARCGSRRPRSSPVGATTANSGGGSWGWRSTAVECLSPMPFPERMVMARRPGAVDDGRCRAVGAGQ